MASTSAIPSTIDALLALATAALPAVQVIDGPGITDDSQANRLFIGVDDPDAESAVTAAEAQSNWSALGHRQREENLTINCAAVSWTGDDSMKAARDAAAATVAAIEQLIVTDPTLGGAVLYATFGGIATLRQDTADIGVVAHALFTVQAKARLV